MSPVTISTTSSLTALLIVLICLFWPFLAASFLSRRGTSAGPAAAVLVPLALSVGVMMMGLHSMLVGGAISGSGKAAASAGIAEALAFLGIGATFAMFVLVAAAIRRHRPFVDRLTGVLFALLVVEIGIALLVGRAIGSGSGKWQLYACVAGAIGAGAIALIAGVWTFLAGRGRVSSRPLPYGVLVIAVLCVVIGVIVSRSVQHYALIAKFGWT